MDVKKTKRQHTQDAREEGEEYYGRSTARPAGNAKIRGGAAGQKTQFSGTLGLPRLGKDARG